MIYLRLAHIKFWVKSLLLNVYKVQFILLHPSLLQSDTNALTFPIFYSQVYRASDQSAKFLPVNKETTAREVVMLSIQIFNINDPSGSSNYALYEVTVTEEGIHKQKRLPDSLQNLAERIGELSCGLTGRGIRIIVERDGFNEHEWINLPSYLLVAKAEVLFGVIMI